MSDSLFDHDATSTEPRTRGKSGRVKATPKTEPDRWVTKWSRRYDCGHEAFVNPATAKHHTCPACGEGTTLDTVRIREPA